MAELPLLPSSFLCLLCSFFLLLGNPAPSAADDVVDSVLQQLKQSSGKADETFKAYERIAGIITEGTGVGGTINYKGVQLDRGYVADEDTSIYNPGLTLLTETEKTQLVDAVIASRNANIKQQAWSQDLQLGYEFLKERLDPLHVVELRGYLRILPFYGAAVYLAVLAVQQLARDLFPVAYMVGVIAVFGPAILLVLRGPQ